MIGLSTEFKQILEYTQPSAILCADAPFFTIAHANQAYCQLSGTQLTDLIGNRLFNAFPQNPEDAQARYVEQVKLNLLECLDGKKETVLPAQRYDIRLPGSANFITRYNQVTNTPIINGDGKVTYILHKVTDITAAYELALKEKIALQVAEAKGKELENLFNQAPAGIVIFSGRNLVFDLVNPIYQSFFPGRELLGKPLLEALPELRGHSLIDGFLHTYATGETYHGKEVSTRLERIPGEPLQESYWNFIGQARYDDNQEINGILMFGFEVTEQVLLRKKVEESEERLNLAAENVESGVYDTDLITGKSIRSLRHAQIFGYPDNREDWSLAQMQMHILQEDLTRTQQEYAKGLETGQINLKFRIKRLDGEIRWINILGKVNYNEQDEPVRIVGTTTDITDQVSLQRQKDEFVSTVSHELKTPVTSIKAYGQLLKRSLLKAGDSTNSGFLEKMDIQIDRLVTLIKNLLEVTRIESGNLSLHPESLQFDSFVLEIISELQVITPTHQLVITENRVPLITADPSRLSQVITNLVTNAVKYSPQASEVQIAVKEVDCMMVCSVQDFGIGIHSKNTARFLSVSTRLIKIRM
jgi:two-component system sensor histidine kinase VicK